MTTNEDELKRIGRSSASFNGTPGPCIEMNDLGNGSSTAIVVSLNNGGPSSADCDETSIAKDSKSEEITINVNQVYIGGSRTWVHIIFDSHDEAVKVSEKLYEEKLVGNLLEANDPKKRAPKVHELHENNIMQPQYVGVNFWFFRVFFSDYFKMAKKYKLPKLEELRLFKNPVSQSPPASSADSAVYAPICGVQ